MSLFKNKIKVAKQKKITNRIIRQVEAFHCYKSTYVILLFSTVLKETTVSDCLVQSSVLF